VDEVLVSEALVSEVKAHGYDVTGRHPLRGDEGRLAAW
jgi:hypothetical protein